MYWCSRAIWNNTFWFQQEWLRNRVQQIPPALCHLSRCEPKNTSKAQDLSPAVAAVGFNCPQEPHILGEPSAQIKALWSRKCGQVMGSHIKCLFTTTPQIMFSLGLSWKHFCSGQFGDVSWVWSRYRITFTTRSMRLTKQAGIMAHAETRLNRLPELELSFHFRLSSSEQPQRSLNAAHIHCFLCQPAP